MHLKVVLFFTGKLINCTSTDIRSSLVSRENRNIQLLFYIYDYDIFWVKFVTIAISRRRIIHDNHTHRNHSLPRCCPRLFFTTLLSDDGRRVGPNKKTSTRGVSEKYAPYIMMYGFGASS